MQLNPLEQFTIVRQLDWAGDPSTYYVQAVIYNVQNNSVIATVNLANQGNQKFTGVWQVLGNPGMMGFYISIVTTVYTDSAYTQVSQQYSTTERTYLVQQRYVPALGPNGGGMDIDYKAIRKLIQEELGFLKKKKERREITEDDIEGIMYKVMGGMFDQVGNPLRALQDGYARNEKFISDMSAKKDQQVADLLAGFRAMLGEFTMNLSASTVSHQKMISETVSAAVTDLMKLLNIGAESSKTDHTKFHADMMALIEKHFKSLIDGENKNRKAELDKIATHISKAISTIPANEITTEQPPKSNIPAHVRDFLKLPVSKP